jgi:plastocyanin
MRAINLAILTIAAVLAVAACSGSSTPASTAAPAAASPAAGSGSPASAAPAAGGSAVTIANFSFAPATITVPVGATVTWTNNDSAGHTVTAGDGSFKSGKLASGATFSQTFAAAGTYAYHCSIHASMTGIVTVK